MIPQVEVGAESLRRLAAVVPLENELDRLVLPGDPVEVEEPRELPLRFVGEPRRVAGPGRPGPGVRLRLQGGRLQCP